MKKKEDIFGAEKSRLVDVKSVGDLLVRYAMNSIGVAFFPPVGYCIWILNGSTIKKEDSREVDKLRTQIMGEGGAESINRKWQQETKQSNMEKLRKSKMPQNIFFR